MTLNDYQDGCMRTAPYQNYKTDTDMLENAAWGMCGESGEVADIIKKWKYQGHNLDANKLALEIGDVFYYVALAAKGIHLTLEDIAEMNQEKLKKRYPEGFDPDRSVNRDYWEAYNENRKPV